MKSKHVLTVSVVTLLVQLAMPFAKADCAGCGGVQAAAEKLRDLKNRTGKIKRSEITSLLDHAGKAVLAMPRGDGNKLTVSQVHEVVQLLRVTQKLDEVQLVTEEIIDLIRASKNDFRDEVKKLPATEASAISEDISMVLRDTSNEEGFSSDALPPKAK